MVRVTSQPESTAASGGEVAVADPIDGSRIAARADQPALAVGAVARRLGIAPATLRTWDRRYGLGPSGHTTGHHRRYRPLDIARLELMQRALLRGASPAEAARYALEADSMSAGTEPAFTAEGEVEPEPPRSGGSGGRVLSLPGAGRAARGLGRAVLAMDTTGAAGLLADAIGAGGVVGAWNEVIRPVLGATTQRWEHSGVGAEYEHLLHECVLTALMRATPPVPQARNPRPVLLACVPGERHSLPLRALVAELAGRELATRMFGPALPADALAAAIRRTAPAAVVLWAELPSFADVSLVEKLPRTRQRARVFLAGPGWSRGADSPHLLVDSLGPAADEIERVVLGWPD
jgi:transposase-like protein